MPRSRGAAKRGVGVCELSLEKAVMRAEEAGVDVIKLDDALKELAKLDPRQSRIVELRFFAGLSIEDTSKVLGISSATVKREWATARAWLYRELVGGTSV